MVEGTLPGTRAEGLLDAISVKPREGCKPVRGGSERPCVEGILGGSRGSEGTDLH